ncbi:far upstream element-binding protein 3-like isoform X4 [Cynoglossus semilaevis]|uniref:far upstream element-binding protein 3-like isoform X4 n=1 Tax=Cynoglossus semilaevis TaxID=244447 RepID=UPI0004975DF5|nr:far upstream element-binding protein 3-like isoform X4 [Cynoglossus semilaevis]
MMAELVQGQASMNQPGLKSDGLADALQRARQMVGKIGGETISHLNSSSGSVDASLYYPGQKRPGEDGGNQLAAMGHQSRVITEDYKVPDRMVGFIIGRGGEQITRIQLESGCKIQIASDSGGLMERPCSLTGTPESIEQAKRLLIQIVDRCRNGPGFHGDGEAAVQEMLIPASKVGLVIGRGGDTIKQLQERAGVKMMMIQDGPMPTGADKPLRISGDPYKVQAARELVLEVIREKDGDFRSGRNDFSARLGGTSLDVPVPRFAVGIVIGRNGEMIKKIQNDAGVRIQFKADDGISPERVAMVMGQPDRCQHAVHLINELVQTAQERDGFGSALRGSRVRGRNDWTMGSPGPLQEVTYTIPADKCGLVIGKGGETIKNINQQSGAHVELQRNPPPSTDPNTRVFTIRGTAQQMDLARQLIDDKIGGSGIMSNGGFGFSPFTQGPTSHQNCGSGQTFLTGVWGNTYQTNWQNPGQQDPGQQSQPQNLMTDYSKAWEDYYKKQSMTRPSPSVVPAEFSARLHCSFSRILQTAALPVEPGPDTGSLEAPPSW